MNEKLIIQRIFSLPTLIRQDLFFFPGKVFLTLSQSNFDSYFSLFWSESCKGLVQVPRRWDLSLGDIPDVLKVFCRFFCAHHPCSRQPSALFRLVSSIIPWSCPWLYPAREGKVREGDVRECRCSHSSSFSLLPTDSKPQPSTYLGVIFARVWPRMVPTFQIFPQLHPSERSTAVEGKEEEKEMHLYLQECRNLPRKALGVPCLRFSGIWVYIKLETKAAHWPI